MMTLDDVKRRLQLATKITAMSPTRLATRAGLSNTTLTRVLSGQTQSIPSPRTLEAVDRVVRAYIESVAARDPALADMLTARWDERPTTGQRAGAGSALDEQLMRQVIQTIRHDLRHAWPAITADALADMIIGTYTEAVRLANCDADCDADQQAKDS